MVGRRRGSDREQRWRKHMAAWRQSGMNQAEYCRREGLPAAGFSWWKKELMRRGMTSRPREGSLFVPVQVRSGVVEAGCWEVELRNGRRLRMGRQVEPEEAARMAAALEGVAPC